MRQQLEQSLYEIKPLETQRERIYQVGDLEFLSSTIFYTGKIKSSFGHADPLGFSKAASKINKRGSGKLPDIPLYGTSEINKVKFTSTGVETINVDSKGDAVKSYSDLINNNLSVGFQPKGEKHSDYKELGIINLGNLIHKHILDIVKKIK